MEEKCMLLLLFEIGLISESGIEFDENFLHLFNNFVSRYYKKYPQLFHLVLIIENSKEEESRYFPGDIESFTYLINEYSTNEKYLKLIEEVGYETDKKINELAILFVEYVQELKELYYMPLEGYQKILQ